MNYVASITAITTCFLAAARGASAQCEYEVEIIKGGIFAPPIRAHDINDDGTICGVWGFGISAPFIWKPGAELVELGIADGFIDGWANAINADGHVAGSMDLSLPHATRWIGGDAGENLGVPPEGNSSAANDINDSGMIVGKWVNNFLGRQAFVWQDGVMLDLAADLGTENSEAHGVGEDGSVVGWMGTDYLDDGQAFLWKDGVVTPFANPARTPWSAGEAINSSGTIVGWGITNGFTSPIMWEDGAPQVLETFPEFELTAAADINDDGVVVGTAGLPEAFNGVLWRDGEIVNLNDLVPPELHVTLASGINQHGQIAAHGKDEDGDFIAMRLTPVPGPLGDLTGDCIVGAEDLIILLGAWGRCPGECLADLDGDGVVGTGDLILLLGNWG